MRTYSFKVNPHPVLLGVEMVEVRTGNTFIACIYPHEDGICVVSRYLKDVRMERHLPLQTAILSLESLAADK